MPTKAESNGLTELNVVACKGAVGPPPALVRGGVRTENNIHQKRHWANRKKKEKVHIGDDLFEAWEPMAPFTSLAIWGAIIHGGQGQEIGST
jgi:hypothetical protein